MKIAVIGYSGSGKSTLAKALAAHYGIPVLHLDSVNFVPGWEERDREEAMAQVFAFMQQPDWVIDGNYGGFYREERLAAADEIIFLNFPRRICLLRAYRRYRTYHGRVREDMAPGCAEKFDFEFFRWIMWEGRTKQKKQQYAKICRQYADKTVVLGHPQQVENYLQSKNITT